MLDWLSDEAGRRQIVYLDTWYNRYLVTQRVGWPGRGWLHRGSAGGLWKRSTAQDDEQVFQMMAQHSTTMLRQYSTTTHRQTVRIHYSVSRFSALGARHQTIGKQSCVAVSTGCEEWGGRTGTAALSPTGYLPSVCLPTYLGRWALLPVRHSTLHSPKQLTWLSM